MKVNKYVKSESSSIVISAYEDPLDNDINDRKSITKLVIKICQYLSLSLLSSAGSEYVAFLFCPVDCVVVANL